MENVYSYKYPHPAVTADCVVFGFDGKELKVLLIERGIEPYKGNWALPGGFLHMDETAEECARRELKEETGIEVNHLEQIGAFSAVDRDPRERIITIAHYALVRQSQVSGGDDAAQAQWFSLTEIPPLAFDHKTILEKALEQLRHNICFAPIGFNLLDEIFEMGQLQRLYESILQHSFDRRNFSSKMLRLGLIESIAERPDGTPSRIPNKYRFNKEKYFKLKKSGFKLEF